MWAGFNIQFQMSNTDFSVSVEPQVYFQTLDKVFVQGIISAVAH